jgi:hypothetical protein
LFEDTKTICKELSSARYRQKPLGSVFAALNDDCLAQNTNRELKLILVKPPGYENSEMAFKCLATPFFTALGGGGAQLTEVMEIANTS